MEITDASNYPGHAEELFAPETESEVAAILKRASQKKIPVTVCGALTGLAGGARLFGAGLPLRAGALEAVGVRVGHPFDRVGEGYHGPLYAEISPKTFVAGQTVHVSGAEAQLRPYGTPAFQVSPASAIVTWQREDDPRRWPGRAS